MRGLATVVIALFLVQSALAVCTVYTPAGPQYDDDCDGVLNSRDNCPTPNPDQRDMNRNGVGDACEKLTKTLVLKPDTRIEQGEFTKITYELQNNRNARIRNITVTVENEELDIEMTASHASIPSGYTVTDDLWFQIPDCATPRTYTFLTTVTFTEPSGERSEETVEKPLRVYTSDACTQGSATLHITAPDKVDVSRGERVTIPLILQGKPGPIDITLIDMADIGTWRVDPSETITLSDEPEYASIDIHATGSPGQKQVYIIVAAEETTTFTVPLYIRQEKKTEIDVYPLITAFIALIIIIVIVIMVLFRKPPTRAIDRAEEKQETYY